MFALLSPKVRQTSIAMLAMLICGSLSSCSNNSVPEEVPESFRVLFETTKGNFTLQVNRQWSPSGAERFFELVKSGFYNDCRFFRVLPGFIVQWGINGDPKVQRNWVNAYLPDDPVRVSNHRGTISFAKGGPNSRTTQVFINLADNSRLDESGFSPFGQVIEGLDVVEKLYSSYGEGAPKGSGPRQDMIQLEGNEYLTREFSQLDYIKKATFVQ